MTQAAFDPYHIRRTPVELLNGAIIELDVADLAERIATVRNRLDNEKRPGLRVMLRRYQEALRVLRAAGE